MKEGEIWTIKLTSGEELDAFAATFSSVFEDGIIEGVAIVGVTSRGTETDNNHAPVESFEMDNSSVLDDEYTENFL